MGVRNYRAAAVRLDPATGGAYLTAMAIRRILTCDTPADTAVLKRISTPVEAVDDGLRALMDDMLETMYDAPGIEEEADGLFATCIQHEMDHLEGVLFIDHLSRLRRDRAVSKVKKFMRTKVAA